MFNNFAIVAWSAPIFVLVAIVALAVLAFEIFMVISAVQNDKISTTAKAWWVVGMFLVHPFVAVAYYFTEYKKPRSGVLKV